MKGIIKMDDFEKLEWVEVKAIEPMGKIYDQNGNEVTIDGDDDNCHYCDFYWRDIESAPEGVDVLVIRRDSVIHVAKVSGVSNKFGVMNVDFGNANCSFFFPINGDYDSDVTPTHWMPLPQPPKESAK